MEKFILLKHSAYKAGLHHDLRFQVPGRKDWDSYAIRKGPPLKVGEKRMAVKTTYHTEEEAMFVGEIPKGQYGAGTLEIEDQGKCEVMKYKPNHIVINFHGTKLNGIYHFISMASIGKSISEKNKTYLFFKGKMT
jgi:bifunctional non-homologous end joining protein LigD